MKKTIVKIIILVLILIDFDSEALAQETRIRFARGSTSASVSGRLGGGWERGYVLGARYGQYLTANVSSRNGCVTFIANGATSIGYTTRWGNNFLYLSNGCRGTTRFTLTVSIRY